MNEMKLVLIEWEDSFGCSPGWSPLEDLTAVNLTCRSVGWLACDGDESKVLVPNVSGKHPSSNRQGCGDIVIPTRAITKITELCVAGGAESGSTRGCDALDGERDGVKEKLT